MKIKEKRTHSVPKLLLKRKGKTKTKIKKEMKKIKNRKKLIVYEIIFFHGGPKLP